MNEISSVEKVKKELVRKIKNYRIQQNLTQKEFSLKSGITLSTYKSFEQKGKGNFENFLIILYTLDKLHELDNLLQDSKNVVKNSNVRQRVRKEQKQIKRKKKKAFDSSTRSKIGTLLKLMQEN